MTPLSLPPKPTPDDADGAPERAASAAPTPTPFWQRSSSWNRLAVIVLLEVVLIVLLKRFLTSPQLKRFLIGFMYVIWTYAITFYVSICLAFLAYGATMLYLVLSARSGTSTVSLRAQAPHLFESLPWLLELVQFVLFLALLLFLTPPDGDDIKLSGGIFAFVIILLFQLACALCPGARAARRRIADARAARRRIADATQNTQSDLKNEAEEAPLEPHKENA